MSKIYYIYAENNQEFVEKNKTLEVWTSEINYVTFSQIAEIDVDKASHLLVTGCLAGIMKSFSAIKAKLLA